MTEPAAFRGVLTAIKPLKTTGEVQFIVTVPQELADDALKSIGGFVRTSESRWVAVARIIEPEKSEDGAETKPDYLGTVRHWSENT